MAVSRTAELTQGIVGMRRAFEFPDVTLHFEQIVGEQVIERVKLGIELRDLPVDVGTGRPETFIAAVL